MKKIRKLATADWIFIAITLGIFILVLFGKQIAPYSPIQINMKEKFLPFSSQHLFGTDHLGRDVFSRIIVGSESTILTSAFILLVSVAIGSTLGLVAGYVGGKFDWLIMRLVDMAMVFPDYIIAIIIVGVLGGGTGNLIFATVFVKWFSYCRLSRSIILSEKNKEYVISAKVSGMKTPHILTKHMLPYVLGSTIALAIVDVGKIILLIASLSYLGLGFKPPTPEWGAMLNDGREFFSTQPQMMIIPGIAICLSVLFFNYIGSRISKKLNVRDKAGE